MQLTPEVLGDVRCVDLIRKRSLVNIAPTSQMVYADKSIPTTLSRRQRDWLKKTNVDPDSELAKRLIAATRMYTSQVSGGLSWGMGIGCGIPAFMMLGMGLFEGKIEGFLIGGFMATMSLIGVIAGQVAPQESYKKWLNTPIHTAELDEILKEEQEPLYKSFVLLLRDAISHKSLPRDTEETVTAAITALGAAIHRLPDTGTALEQMDSATLRDQAQQLIDQATVESDMVIRDSLLRRSDALIRSADSADETHQWLRRTAYLRQELDAQITSLRHSLQANTDGEIAIGTIKRAASEATTLGREASKLREATLELDRYLAQSSSAVNETKQTLGRPQ
jgi:hypothetical protein